MTKKQAGALTFAAIIVNASLLSGLIAAYAKIEPDLDSLAFIGLGIAAALIPALLAFRQFGRRGPLGYLRSLVAALLAALLTGAIAGTLFAPLYGTLIGALIPFYFLKIPAVAIVALLGFVVTHEIGKLQHQIVTPSPADQVAKREDGDEQ